jgi:sterol desaturase/sphingolipid hydroxylase (fatty acid hydroxylase superfamily)
VCAGIHPGMGLELYTAEALEAAQGRIPRNPDGSKVKSIRVFKSRVFEFFSLAHPITPALWWVPAVVYGVWFGTTHVGAARTALQFGAGLFVWTFLEYILHRFIFHWPAHDEAGRFRRFMLHWYHHEFPQDPMRLLAPPLMSWTIAVVVWTAFRLLCGPLAVWPVFAGCALGYLVYDYTHYYTHHAKPKTALGKWLRRYHLRHHHEHEESRFGVSSPLWDLVFGTYKPLTKGKTASAH